jgi:hypothetical protein
VSIAGAWNRLEHVVRSIALRVATASKGNCSNPYGIFQDDPDYCADPERLALAVEYTRDSIAALIWEVSSRVYLVL